MLSPIKSIPRLRRFFTYDLEWVPGTLELRVAGLYDGNCYRPFTSIESFLACVLRRENSGAWFYAHAGGMADMLFILEWLLKSRGYQVNASFSSSSAIIVKVSRGKAHWWFLDSYWLFRDKLRNIAKSVGMAKGGIDDSDEENLSDADWQRKQLERREWYRTVSYSELVDYNTQDCKILWAAINRFEAALLERGSVLMKTIAACGLMLFRRKYLKREIETSAAVNDCAIQSYTASRVEVFNRHVTDSYYYDINSSFPYAMTFPLPGNILGSVIGRLPRNPDTLYIADCEVEVEDQYCPPIPLKVEHKVFFPVGRWRGWFTGVDLELLQREEGRIIKVHESIAFEPFTDLGDYAVSIFEHRKQCTDEFERLVDKYLLNCVYGKFAESPNKRFLQIDPPTCQRCGHDQCNCRNTLSLQELMPGVWLKESTVSIPHRHVPISTYITSYARRTIYDYMTPRSRFDYCDTDGFSCPDWIGVGKDLGALKLEKIIGRPRVLPPGYECDEDEQAEFVQPKVYQIRGKVLGPNGWEQKTLSRAKGFSRMNAERWMKLREGEDIHFERMRRIRELYRSGTFRPEEKLIRKRLKGDNVPKRFTYPDGSTRPWSVEELKGLIPKRRK